MEEIPIYLSGCYDFSMGLNVVSAPITIDFPRTIFYPANPRPRTFDSEMIILSDKEKLRMEVNEFELNKIRFLEEYEGKYIALVNGKVLDSDKDFHTLAKKIFEKYDYRPIYMPFVTREKHKIRIATPKFKSKKTL